MWELGDIVFIIARDVFGFRQGEENEKKISTDY
jgi:hypothetical protein